MFNEIVVADPSEAVIAEVPCADKEGEANYQARLLREFDANYGLTVDKIRELWTQVSKHKTLFSDQTNGQFRPFFYLLMDPKGVWIEIHKPGEELPAGVCYLTHVKPYFEADIHFAIWDHIVRGREPLALFMIEWALDRYNLHRLNAYIPRYQGGTLRFAKRLGFVVEGEKREGVLYDGERHSLITLGILRHEVERKISALW